jgi:predicted nucleic acid-binding protein
VSLNTDHFIHARLLVVSTDSSLRTLDALHLAVAITEALTLMTADRDFARAAKLKKRPTVLVH